MEKLTAAPVLETPRLKLRAHTVDDFAACAPMWTAPSVSRYLGGKPLSDEEIWAKLLRYTGHWPLMGFGYWAVEEKSTGRFLGELGFADFKRDIQPPLGSTPEAGWIFAPAAQGQGYASEALGAALAWGEPRFEGGRTICLIHPENLVSIRLAEKFGYQEFRRAVYKDRPAVLFERAGGKPK